MSRNNKTVDDISMIENLFQIFYKSSNQLVNSTTINIVIVFLFVYILVRQILGYFEKSINDSDKNSICYLIYFSLFI